RSAGIFQRAGYVSKRAHGAPIRSPIYAWAATFALNGAVPSWQLGCPGTDLTPPVKRASSVTNGELCERGPVGMALTCSKYCTSKLGQGSPKACPIQANGGRFTCSSEH